MINRQSKQTSGQRSERSSPSRDDRVARLQSEDRGERGHTDADDDRQFAHGTMVTVVDDNEDDFSEWAQEALPTPPAMPGWHFCWLSTTSTYDPIHKRIQNGYVPVRYSDVPGFDVHKDSTGSGLEDVIACNEMRLYRIPMERYLRTMKHFHHDQPRDSEEAIRARVEALQGKIGSDRAENDLVKTEEGFQTIVKRGPARFSAS